MVTREMLYDAAFRYKKAGLWKKLWDNEIFAVRLSNGQIGYVSIMGRNGEYCALGLYVGEAGAQSYRTIANADFYEESEFRYRECLLQQYSLQVVLGNKDDLLEEELKEARDYGKKHGIRYSGKNAYPQFLKFEPDHYQWKVKKEDDRTALYEAMEAAVLMSDLLSKVHPKELGIFSIGMESTQVPLLEIRDGKLIAAGMAPFPEEKEKTYEAISVHNDIVVAALKKLPKKDTWEAEVVRMLKPVQEDPDDAPYYPLLPLIVNHKTEYLLPVSMVMNAETNTEEFLQEYAEAWKRQKSYPKEIRCRDERTYAMLKDISEKTGVKICIYPGEMEALDEVEDELMGDLLNEDDGDIAGMMSDIVDYILDMGPEEISAIPSEIMDHLKLLIDSDVLPEDITDEIRKKLRYR